MASGISLQEKEINYILNELDCINLRVEQINQYRRKIRAILQGNTIKTVDEKYKPIIR